MCNLEGIATVQASSSNEVSVSAPPKEERSICSPSFLFHWYFLMEYTIAAQVFLQESVMEPIFAMQLVWCIASLTILPLVVHCPNLKCVSVSHFEKAKFLLFETAQNNVRMIPEVVVVYRKCPKLTSKKVSVLSAVVMATKHVYHFCKLF